MWTGGNVPTCSFAARVTGAFDRLPSYMVRLGGHRRFYWARDNVDFLRGMLRKFFGFGFQYPFGGAIRITGGDALSTTALIMPTFHQACTCNNLYRREGVLG
jgi:hypothetical protein